MGESVFNVVFDIPDWLGASLGTSLGGLLVIVLISLFFRLIKLFIDAFNPSSRSGTK